MIIFKYKDQTINSQLSLRSAFISIKISNLFSLARPHPIGRRLLNRQSVEVLPSWEKKQCCTLVAPPCRTPNAPTWLRCWPGRQLPTARPTDESLSSSVLMADEPLPPPVRLTSSRPHRQLPESPNQRAKMAMLQLTMGESRDREGARALGLSDFGSTAA